MRTFMGIHFVPVMYKQGIDGMKQCIVQPVGSTFPMFIVYHYQGCIVCSVGFLYFKVNNYPAFFVRKTHINTILSCSTFL